MQTEFSGQNAYEHLRVLTEEIGPRHGGSKNEKRAAEYIRDVLDGFGLETRLEPYPIYSFTDATASLETPAGKQIPCAAVPISQSTPAQGISRETVFVESADAVHLDERVSDRIVVMFNTFGGDLRRRFHAYNPAGLVSIQTRPRQQHVRAPYKAAAKRKTGSVPTVRVTLEHGIDLISNLPEGLTLKVVTEDERTTEGHNVIADLASARPDEEDVVTVCAHFDSVWAGPGAVDNGGGAAAMLELARIYAEKGSNRNLRFIAFGGEETGLWGAYSYVKKLSDEDKKLKKNKDFERDGLRSELDKIRFLVNLDMMGQLYGTSTAITLGHPDIAASARLLANELRYALKVKENSIYSSDNMAFNYAKIPSISFNRCGYESCGGHTSDDTIEHCSADGLAHIGSLIETWIDRYVMAHTFPFTRTLPDAAKKAVKDWFKDRNPLDYEVFGPEKKYDPEKDTGQDSCG